MMLSPVLGITRLRDFRPKSGGASDPSVVILRPAWASNPNPPNLAQTICKRCGLDMNTDDILELLTDAFHISCFRCTVCDCQLSGVEATFWLNSWRCMTHAGTP
uniref:LIM zinc-binding domain-containing protein n=1 Tax=Mesocestoides corti TaxID=53468 RepID=A0A5K3F7J4_MESCO